MGCSAKVRESRYECEGIRSLHEHECHRRPEEYDIGGRVFDKEFAFEPSSFKVSFCGTFGIVRSTPPRMLLSAND